MTDTGIVICSIARTPIGSFLGGLSSLSAPQLGAVAIREAVQRASIEAEQVTEVYMGNVLSAGIGQAPARQAALGAGLGNAVPCTTVSKVCGSGMQALICAYRSLQAGDARVVVAGGMESMSNAPYYVRRARSGLRMGHATMDDGMILDGLWDPYGNFHMGNAAEQCASRYELSRQAQDTFAKESYRRALEAQQAGVFQQELVAVDVPGRKGNVTRVTEDEEPSRGVPEKLGQLRAAFDKDGTITAGNASSINDGACAVVMMQESEARALGAPVLARVRAYAGFAGEPTWFTTAPIHAAKRVLERASLSAKDVDLWEINEAFACVTLACQSELSIDPQTVNVHGGAVALGHPIGASGARIVATLIAAMHQRKKRLGVATLCIGGGEALAMALEAA